MARRFGFRRFGRFRRRLRRGRRGLFRKRGFSRRIRRVRRVSFRRRSRRRARSFKLRPHARIGRVSKGDTYSRHPVEAVGTALRFFPLADGVAYSHSFFLNTVAGVAVPQSQAANFVDGVVVTPAAFAPGTSVTMAGVNYCCTLSPAVGSSSSLVSGTMFARYGLYRVRRVRVYLTWAPPDRTVTGGGAPPGQMPELDLVVCRTGPRGMINASNVNYTTNPTVLIPESDTIHYRMACQLQKGQVYRKRLCYDGRRRVLKFSYTPYLDAVQHQPTYGQTTGSLFGPTVNWDVNAGGFGASAAPLFVQKRRRHPWLPTVAVVQATPATNPPTYATNDDLPLHGLQFSFGTVWQPAFQPRFGLRIVYDLEFKHPRITSAAVPTGFVPQVYDRFSNYDVL